RAAVDHRIGGAAGFLLEADRVERVAGGLDADPLQDGIAPAVLEREPVDEWLGDRLDRERSSGVADLVDATVRGGQGNPEPVWIGFRQLGNVGRDLTGAEIQASCMELLEVVLDGQREAPARELWQLESPVLVFSRAAATPRDSLGRPVITAPRRLHGFPCDGPVPRKCRLRASRGKGEFRDGASRPADGHAATCRVVTQSTELTHAD